MATLALQQLERASAGIRDRDAQAASLAVTQALGETGGRQGGREAEAGG